ERWPNLVETALKKMTLNSRGCGADLGVLAKVFFGCEYECSRGHRFIASSPSFKASKSSRGVSTRGWGAQVAGSDMPLYIPCSCSSRRSTSLGPLLRIHVVSPKAPLNVKLNPRIQPTEGGPIFLPGLSEPFKLPPNTYWILRLPFLYASKDAGVHLPPLFMENEAGKLFKGSSPLQKTLKLTEETTKERKGK
ncbi:Protein SMG8like, partial [Caligus rogercresseyi]